LAKLLKSWLRHCEKHPSRPRSPVHLHLLVDGYASLPSQWRVWEAARPMVQDCHNPSDGSYWFYIFSAGDVMNLKLDIKVPRDLLPDADELERILENALTMTAKAVKVDFDTTTKTWNTRPEFQIARGKFLRTVFTEDANYGFVNDGTTVRYALMSPDFKAKTTPGFIGSKAGAGDLIIVNRNHPRPGIKARKFDEAIADKWEKEFPIQVQRAIDSEF
jgi:hypothetical protein